MKRRNHNLQNNKCLIKIRGIYPSFNDAERRVADFVLKYSEKTIDLSITQVASKSSVSIATITRFVNLLGFKNFPSMKISLAQDLSSPFQNIHEDIKDSDNPATVIHKVFHTNIQSLYDTLEILNSEDVVKVVGFLCNADNVVLYGVGGSAAVALDAQNRFLHLGINCHSYVDPYIQLVISATLSKNDLAIGISHTGKTKPVCEALVLAKKQGAKTICITNYIGSPITKNADICLYTALREKKVSTATMSSRIAQLAIIDAIYILTAIKKYRNILPTIERVNREVDNKLRY